MIAAHQAITIAAATSGDPGLESLDRPPVSQAEHDRLERLGYTSTPVTAASCLRDENP